MRISAVTASVVVHAALLAMALSLPASLEKRVHDPVTVDLFTRPKPPIDEPPPKQITPPLPAALPKVAAHESAPTTKAPPPEPEPAHPQVAETPPPSETRPTGKVDLTLHALPTGSENAVAIPSGTGTFGETVGAGGKKPWKMRGDAGNPLTGKLADEPEDRFPLRPVGGGEFEYKGKAFAARIGRDGRVNFDDKSIRDFKGLSGGFDITDMLMRAKGNDPYRAKKQAFMQQTEAMRKKMAQAALKERINDSLASLPALLDSIWRDTQRSIKERHGLLFATWKDAAGSEADVGDSANSACEIVEVYVRRYLPKDSEGAFTIDELASLNRGLTRKFDPYR